MRSDPAAIRLKACIRELAPRLTLDSFPPLVQLQKINTLPLRYDELALTSHLKRRMRHQDQTMDAPSHVANFFGRLQGLPCWHWEQTYASWLSINFGQPHLKITEADPNAKSRYRRKRSVLVDGDHRLSITMSEWHIIMNGHELAWSNSPRKTIREALCEINGQNLFKVDIDIVRRKTTFLFESNIELRVKSDENLKRCDSLWKLFSRNQLLALTDEGYLSFDGDVLSSPLKFHGAQFSYDLTRGTFC